MPTDPVMKRRNSDPVSQDSLEMQKQRKTNFSKLDFKTAEECRVLVDEPKYKALDGLRGFAVMGIFLNHFFQMFFSLTFDVGGIKWVEKPSTFIKLYRRSPLTVFDQGFFWLIVMFILSGFVLPLKFFKSGQIHCITSSIFRRYFRLAVPVTVTYLIIYKVVRSGVLLHTWPFEIRNESKTLVNVIMDGLFGLWLGHYEYFAVSWSLCIGLTGSFIVYAVAVTLAFHLNV